MLSYTVIPITATRAGEEVRIHSVRADDQHVQRLRELGILEGRTIKVVTDHDPLIFQIGDSRFGVCRRLARSILVLPVRRSA